MDPLTMVSCPTSQIEAAAQRRTVERASAGKVHFWKMLFVTIFYEPMTLKMSSVSRGPDKEYSMRCFIKTDAFTDS